MIKGLKFISLLLLFGILVSNRNTDCVSRQQEDYAVFSTVLKEKEGKIDMHLSSDSVTLYLQKLQYELNSEKSILEQYKLYSSTLAKLNCGHTQILPSRSVQAEWLLELKALPIDFYLIGRRLVVNNLVAEDIPKVNSGKSTYQKSKNIEPDSEILTIDHLTVEQMMVQMGKYMSGDEGSLDFKYFQAAQMFEFYRHLAMPFEKDSVHVKYVTPRKDTQEIYLQPGPAPVHSMNKRLEVASSSYNQDEADMGKFKIVNSKYGYFRFNSFTSSSGRDYDAFLKNAFQKIKRNKIDKIVVDLRGNTGGVMQYDFMKYLVGEGVNVGKYIIEKPNSKTSSKYIRKFNMHYLRHTLLSGQQNRRQRNGVFNEGIIETDWVDSTLIYNGQIIVITDEGTFSSAAILACQLKTMKGAKIVGRPAGGSFYGGNAGTLLVKLPQSGFKMSVNPNTFYSHLDWSENPTAIKQPDLYLDPLIIDSKKRDQYYFKHAISLFN